MSRRLKRLLDEHSFQLLRHGKHFVFTHPTGARLTVSASPRNEGAQWQEVRRDVRRIVGRV